jgi:hypothetical protein
MGFSLRVNLINDFGINYINTSNFSSFISQLWTSNISKEAHFYKKFSAKNFHPFKLILGLPLIEICKI